MLKSTEDKILANSRLALVNSFFIPTMIGCVVLSGVYLSCNLLINMVFGWMWLGLGVLTFYKYKKAKKIVLEGLE